MKFVRKKLNEGFENPFNNVDIDATDIKVVGKPLVIDDFGSKITSDDKVKISNVKLWNRNTKNKVIYDPAGKRMIAGQYFSPDDIVEECPYIELGEKDMYSENIRAASFTVDYETRRYALPLGFALCYRNSVEVPSSAGGNIEYIVDEDRNMIVFKALKNIKKGNELVISAEDSDFVNEIKPGQFEYKAGPEAVYSIKDYRIS